MRETILAIDELELDQLSHEGEVDQEAFISWNLGTLRDKKLDHQRREEAVLETLRRVLEEHAKGEVPSSSAEGAADGSP